MFRWYRNILFWIIYIESFQYLKYNNPKVLYKIVAFIIFLYNCSISAECSMGRANYRNKEWFFSIKLSVSCYLQSSRIHIYWSKIDKNKLFRTLLIKKHLKNKVIIKKCQSILSLVLILLLKHFKNNLFWWREGLNNSDFLFNNLESSKTST